MPNSSHYTLSVMQVQLAERVSRDANVVQVYGTAAAVDGQSVMLVMELMQVGVLTCTRRCHGRCAAVRLCSVHLL